MEDPLSRFTHYKNKMKRLYLITDFNFLKLFVLTVLSTLCTLHYVCCIMYIVYIEKLHCFKIWQQGLLLTHNPALIELYGREPTVYRDTFYTKTILCSTCLEEWTFILFRQVRLLVPCLRIRMSFKLDLKCVCNHDFKLLKHILQVWT